MTVGGSSNISQIQENYVQYCRDNQYDIVQPFLTLLDEHISKGQSLTKLNLHGNTKELFENRIDSAKIKGLLESLKGIAQIKEIDLSYQAVDDEGAQVIADLIQVHGIDSICLKSNNITQLGVQLITQAIKTAATALCNNDVSYAPPQPKRLCIDKISFRNNTIGDEGALAIADLIDSNVAQVRVLDIGQCSLGQKGIIGICSSILKVEQRESDSCGLQELHLDYTLSKTPQAEVIASMADIFQINQRLTYVNLSHMGIKDWDLQVLVSCGLNQNKSIQRIDLKGNCITSLGAQYLCHVLRTNSIIKHLGLQGNAIGDDAAVELADSLCTSPSIQQIDLRLNRLNDVGCAHLVQKIPLMTQIERMWLWGNGFSDQTGKIVHDMIAEKQYVRYVLDINSQKVDDRYYVYQEVNQI